VYSYHLCTLVTCVLLSPSTCVLLCYLGSRESADKTPTDEGYGSTPRRLTDDTRTGQQMETPFSDEGRKIVGSDNVQSESPVSYHLYLAFYYIIILFGYITILY